MSKDAQYKDGYQVAEGGDYIVSSKGTAYRRHTLTRVSDGRVIGVYCQRASAIKRAQQLGGNSSRAHRALWSGRNIAMTPKEQAFVSARKQKAKEEDLLSESEILRYDKVWTRTLILQYLRPYSPGAGAVRWGRAAHRYTKAAIAEAWSQVPAETRWNRESIRAGYDLPRERYIDAEEVVQSLPDAPQPVSSALGGSNPSAIAVQPSPYDVVRELLSKSIAQQIGCDESDVWAHVDELLHLAHDSRMPTTLADIIGMRDDIVQDIRCVA